MRGWRTGTCSIGEHGWGHHLHRSGKLATEACKADPQGVRPDGVCLSRGPSQPVPDLHVMTRYCGGGHAAANEYCSQVRGNTVTEKGLVKNVRQPEEPVRFGWADYSSLCYRGRGQGGPYRPHQADSGGADRLHGTAQTHSPNEPTKPPETNGGESEVRPMAWISRGWKEYEV